MPKIQSNLGPVEVSAEVQAIIEATRAQIYVDMPDWRGPFPLPAVATFTWLVLPGGEFPDGPRINLACLQFSLNRNERSTWNGMVACMIYTARAIAGLGSERPPVIQFGD